ncbi:MAG: DMT family transporter [Spirochaetes bacterium]|nr:DMT family transporter [Spirochaetota bacterium]MBU1080764.1 DMT family transporter [Spirochaetota bacterium]
MERTYNAPGAARYEALLFITAAIWGTGFVAQRLGMLDLGPFSYNAARFLVGSLALVPLLVARKASLSTVRAALVPGTAAGAVLAVAAGFQQSGLQYTSAGKAGFITGLYVVLVPIAAMVFGRRTPVRAWIGAACALAGLYVLSFSAPASINRGDALVLASAFFWTAHILVLDRWAAKVDPLALACVQFAVCSAICWGGAFATEAPSIADFRAAALPIAYGGLFSIGIAYTLQAVAQSKAHPARASIIMSLESPFAAFAGFLFLGERLGARELIGCAVMLGGTFIAQWPSKAREAPGDRR